MTGEQKKSMRLGSMFSEIIPLASFFIVNQSHGLYMGALAALGDALDGVQVTDSPRLASIGPILRGTHPLRKAGAIKVGMMRSSSAVNSAARSSGM